MVDLQKPAVNASGTPRWIKALLAGSLALNFAVIAGAIGMVATFDGPPPPDGGMPGVGGFVRSLNEEHRREFGDAMRGAFDKRPSRETFMADAQQMITLIRAEPFDSAAFQSHIETVSQRFEDGRRAGDAALIRIIGGMSSAERQDYADRLEKRLSKGFDKDGHKDDFKPR
ncbi:periplasmic heavy metal sensor [Donghicola sp. C2-DW-16]|uniref:Periplasmic heavy metal sensor n=1 Tax=Donghicola mangrovi TaxID=2729614 RepID=A0ABX2PIV4_9RHOB|nr:periplasmic heavy metal sensor [Donghicola mangrovi]NVO29026.1 periplasmic heavy metal sensor [Donghicola mangrovi]